MKPEDIEVGGIYAHTDDHVCEVTAIDPAWQEVRFRRLLVPLGYWKRAGTDGHGPIVGFAEWARKRVEPPGEVQP